MDMGECFLIASGKGGVGKSTIAVSLAQALCARGARVALMDADVGLRCADLMLNLQDRVVYDFADVMDRRCELEDALYAAPGAPGVRLLAASQMTRASQIRPKDVCRVVEALKRSHDIVLVDCPAGVGRSLKINLETLGEFILVATPDDIALRDAERVAQLLSERGKLHPYLICNRTDRRLVRQGVMAAPQTLAETLDMPLLGAVPDSPRVYTGLLRHQTAYHCGDRRVRAAFDRIAARLMGVETAVPDDRPGPVTRFFCRPDM